MKNTLVYGIFITLFALLTFFGIGPVLFADGSMQERILTLVVVLLGYVVLFLLFHRYRQKNRQM